MNTPDSGNHVICLRCRKFATHVPINKSTKRIIILPVGAVVNRLDWSDQNAVGEAFKMGKTSKKNEWGSSDNTYSLTRVADDTPFKFFDRLGVSGNSSITKEEGVILCPLKKL